MNKTDKQKGKVFTTQTQLTKKKWVKPTSRVLKIKNGGDLAPDTSPASHS